MEEELVSLETAILAKASGFKIPTHTFFTNKLLTEEEKDLGYNLEDKLPSYKSTENFIRSAFTYNITYKDLCKYWELEYGRPTQSLLQKWLREEYDIDVEARGFRCAGDTRTNYYQPHINGVLVGKISTKCNTYEEALEYALFEGLSYYLGR